MKIAPSLLQKIFICGATETPVISFNGRNNQLEKLEAAKAA